MNIATIRTDSGGKPGLIISIQDVLELTPIEIGATIGVVKVLPEIHVTKPIIDPNLFQNLRQLLSGILSWPVRIICR